MILRIPKFDGGEDSISIALSNLKKDEGFRSSPYWDPIGKVWTAGYGFTDKKHIHNWSEKNAEAQLIELIKQKDAIARKSKWGEAYANSTPGMQAEILNLMFQGGDAVVDQKMPSFRKALMAGDYEEAANLLDFGIKQTKTRSKGRQDRFRAAIPKKVVVDPTVPVAQPEPYIAPVESTVPINPAPTPEPIIRNTAYAPISFEKNPLFALDTLLLFMPRYTQPEMMDGGKDPSPYIAGPDADYDNFRAYELGYGRASNGHLPSRDYKTGRILKSPMHPTYLKALLEDSRIGYFPYTKNGLTYTDTWKGNEEWNPELNPNRYKIKPKRKK